MGLNLEVEWDDKLNVSWEEHFNLMMIGFQNGSISIDSIMREIEPPDDFIKRIARESQGGQDVGGNIGL